MRIWGKRLAFLLPGGLAVLLYAVLPYAPKAAEYMFARGIFRLLTAPLGALTSLLPFSLTEVLAVAALPGLLCLLLLLIRRLRRTDCPRRVWARAGRAVGWTLSIVLLLYMLLHGLNFYRQPAAELMGLETGELTPETLLTVTKDLARRASEERAALSEDENGCMVFSAPLSDTLRQADDGYRLLEERYPFLWGSVWRAKPVGLSHWWSYTGITGMYFPFLAEANVNIDVPPSELPATAAHELAHTRGFAREDECNFFAYLSCLEHPSADYRYSGTLLAYIYCSNALYDYDQTLWREARSACSEAVLRDLAQRNDYWRQFEGKVQEMSTEANHAFIQAQGDKDGVLSYNRVVRLITAYEQTR